MITRAMIKGEIYEKLNKSAATKGFYTDTKVNLAIQECVDYIAGKMFLQDEGWLHKLKNFDTSANLVSFPIPPDMAMVVEVRYLVGNIYIPLIYDQDFGNSQWAQSSGVVQFPSKYRMVDNTFYFNPPIGVGGAKNLQIEYMAYPKRLQNDSDFLASQFDRSMYYYIIYRSCSVLAGNIAQFGKAWSEQEYQWFEQMLNIISKRNMQTTPIQEFQGY